MKTVLVTGSADGIGRETAAQLARAGHRVVLHARSAQRAAVARSAVPDAVDCVVGDLMSLAQTVALGQAAAAYAPYDAIIHNAGIANDGRRTVTEDNLESTFQVNVLAPYVLTAVIPLPQRLVYVSSGMASQGEIVLDDLQRSRRRWSGNGAYCDSKLADIALAFTVARLLPVRSNAVCPGWVRSGMGGPNAPTDVATGARTQAWLAVSDDSAADMSGRFLRHMRVLDEAKPLTSDEHVQDGLVAACARISGITLHSAGRPART